MSVERNDKKDRSTASCDTGDRSWEPGTKELNALSIFRLIVVEAVRKFVKLLCFFLGFQAVVITSIGLVVSPEMIESGKVRLTSTCPYLAKSGQPCATCGMTRGVSSFFHGQFKLSAEYNSRAPAVAIVELMLVCGVLGYAIRRRKLSRSRNSSPTSL